MSDAPICPCDGFEHPTTISNPAGLSHVAYRAGDFRSFRRALLRPLAGEAALTAWQPNRHGDLLLQVLEWWAYVADVLTFYNERSLNANLLRTAELDENVRRLVGVLGYRPRPGIAASAYAGALLSGPKAVTLPAGFAVESKPAPGKEPQTFESADDVTVTQPAPVPAAPPTQLLGPSGQLYLAGTVTGLKPGELLVLDPLAGAGTTTRTIVAVQTVHHARDVTGAPYTEIVPAAAPPVAATATATQYRLLRSQRAAGLWRYTTTIDVVSTPFELDGVDRSIRAGDFVVMSAPGLTPAVLPVSGNVEEVWYANGNGSTPPASPTVPIALPHSRIYYSAPSGFSGSTWNGVKSQIQVLLDWQPAGPTRDAPVASYAGTPAELVAFPGASFTAAASHTVLIEDADGVGVRATASVQASLPTRLQILSFAGTPPTLKAPLKVYQTVVTLVRGKRVGPEVLGSGDATVPNQSFTLQKSPLTYLPSGDSFKSTLRVYVNGIEWTEAKSFYGQPPDATVFVTREDDAQKTHVDFGDGVNGARLPTGVNNVVAYYRFGSGADAPAAGALTVIPKPYPGLRSLRHPVAAGGGADPEPHDKVRRYAPRSVLTFGRAISADDYEVVAAQAPSVARVRSVYGWDANEQRATVTVYVGDDAAALQSARDALRATADPNRPVSVVAATPVPAALFVGVRIAANRLTADVVAGVLRALADPDTGLVGVNRVQIGEGIYFSQLSEACLDVPGVESVLGAFFWLGRPDPVTGAWFVFSKRANVTAGEFFQIPKEWVIILPEASAGV